MKQDDLSRFAVCKCGHRRKEHTGGICVGTCPGGMHCDCCCFRLYHTVSAAPKEGKC